MGFEDAPEKLRGGGKPSATQMTLQKAVDLGEYNPEYLSTFAEWHTVGKHVQFQFIRQGLDNRRRHLLIQWAEINNMLDFRLKPQLKVALKNIEKQLKTLERDREKLYLIYSE